MRLIECGQRAAQPLSEFDVESVVWRQTMVSADDLDGPCDLLQCCAVENRVQDFESVEKRCGLFCGNSPFALTHQQGIEDLTRPEGRCDRLFAGLQPFEHAH